MKEKSAAQRGAAMVEFALVLPLFLILLFGVVEFALIMHAKGLITQGSREGARWGVVYRTTAKTNAEIQNYVFNNLQGLGLPGLTLDQITITGAGGGTGSPLSVRVTYTYHFLVLPQFIGSLAGDLNLASETVMRLE